MLGAIIGDIVGSRFEFNNTNSLDFELFSSKCDFTDDTICTIAVADALLRDIPFEESLLRWCRAYPHPKGAYGGNFAQWVFSAKPKPYGSFGNGSAMRVSPCGWLESRENALKQARLSAECTHNHPEGIKGAECIADCIFLARRTKDKGAIRELISSCYGYDLSVSCDEIRRTNSFDETCQVTVPQALTCFLESEDFEDAIRLAVSIGGDSDTITAIAGSVSEAYYTIPQHITDKALSYLPREMQSVIIKFKQKYG